MITKQEKGFSGKVWNFVYSSENQLVSVDMVDQNGSSRVEYSYDALGRRIQKKVLRGADVLVNKFIYDSNEIIAELDEDNSILATYTHSGLRTDDVLSVEVTSAGVTRGLASAAGSYQYLKDGLGSIVDIADSNGNIIQHYVYSSFSKLLKVVDGFGNALVAPLIKTSYTYTNREFDEETGLYYYRARYYDSERGQFLTEDPHPGLLKQPGTFNSKYIYVLNNPQNLTDPKGKIPPILIAMAIGAAVNLTAHLLSGKSITLASVAQAIAVGAVAGGVGFAVGGALGGGMIGAMAGGFAGGFSGSMVNTRLSGEDPFSDKGLVKAFISGAFGAAAGVIGHGIYSSISSWGGSSVPAQAASEYSAGFGASAGEAVVDPVIEQTFKIPVPH